jgi:hypothetical protein
MTYARMAGVLYLVIIVLGLFSEIYVRQGLVIPGDPAATAVNISSSEFLFRVGFAADLIVFLSDVAVAVLLYVLFRPVSRTVSLMAAGFRLTGTAIYGVNLLNHLAPLLLLNGSDHLSAFGPGQRADLAYFFLEMHGHGYDLGLVFFGLHCLALGYLLFRSDAFPRTLGVLMVLAFLGYIIGSFTLFLFPDRAHAVAPVYVGPLVGELALCLWLMVRGARVPMGEAAGEGRS